MLTSAKIPKSVLGVKNGYDSHRSTIREVREVFLRK